MKELSIEEKARNYDGVREKIAIRFGSNVAEEIFSEYEESEDERIRKEIIYHIQHCDDTIDEVAEKRMIAWLEKQGEHAKFRDSIQVGDKVTRNRDGILVNLSQLKRVAKRDEKQGEQKPAWSEEDKVMLDKVIERLHKHSAGDKEYLDIYYWLIALKDRVQPQPKQEWKPSDEQIELLREVQQALLGKDCHNRFVNFMYELKRLREE